MLRSWGAGTGFNEPGPALAIDLGAPAAIALLRRLDVSLAARLALPDLTVTTLPHAATDAFCLAVLPGGALALHGPESTLVCDPHSCVVFSHSQLDALRAALAPAATLAIAEAPQGRHLNTPSVTLIADATCLAALQAASTWSGPALLRWHPGGASAWRLVAAPCCLSLAASLLGRPLMTIDPASLAAGRIAATDLPPPPAESWHAATSEARFRIVSLGIAEHADALLAPDLSDQLRHAVVQACSDGEFSLAGRLADAIGLLPACLLPPCLLPRSRHDDVPDLPGLCRDPPWPALLAGADQPGSARLAFQSRGTPARTITILRSLLPGDDVQLCRPGHTDVPLHSDAALFLARRRDDEPALGLRVTLPADPLALYSLADRIARRLAVPVRAVATGWGFCHQVDPTGQAECGNAAWFGLGIDLDELDDATLL